METVTGTFFYSQCIRAHCSGSIALDYVQIAYSLMNLVEKVGV